MRFNKEGQVFPSSPEGKRGLSSPERINPPSEHKALVLSQTDKKASPQYWFDEDDDAGKNDKQTGGKNKTEIDNDSAPEKKGLIKRILEKWEYIKNTRLYALFIIFNLGWTAVFSYFVLTNTKATRDGLSESHSAFSQMVSNWQTSTIDSLYVSSQSTHSWLGVLFNGGEYSGNFGQYWGFTQDYYNTDTPLAKLYVEYTSFNFYDDSNLYDVNNGCPNGYIQCGGNATDVDKLTCLPIGTKCPINHIFSMRINSLNYTSKTNNIVSCEYSCPENATCGFFNPFIQNISNFTLESQIYQTPASVYIKVDFEGNTYYVILTSNLNGWWFSVNTTSNAAVLTPFRQWFDGNYSTIIFWSYNHNDYPIVEFAVNEYKMCNDKNQENVSPNRDYFLMGDVSYANTKNVKSPCFSDTNNYGWVALDNSSEIQFCINNGLFSNYQIPFSYFPCMDYPYFLFYRRYLGISSGCRFLMSEVNSFVSLIQLIFNFLTGIVILIYVNWGMSGIFFVLRTCLFVQKHCLRKKAVLATEGEMWGIEGLMEKIDSLYGFINASIQLSFKLACYIILAHSTFSSDFQKHNDCVISSYITNNVSYLDTTFADVLTNVIVNLTFGSINFLLALISFVSCCIQTKKDVKNLTSDDKKKIVMVLGKMI